MFVGLLIAAGIAAHSLGQEGKPPSDLRPIAFPTLDGALKLDGYLFSPDGAADARHSAVVMMHGCSGLMNPATGRFFGLYMPWVRTLTRAGHVVLVVDSASPRGLGATCGGPAALTMWRARPKDAYAALAYLQQRPDVKADRVALIGWSQGGGAVLYALNERTAARQSAAGQAILAKLPADFRAAVAFYPGACSEAAQKPSYAEGEPNGWTSKVPLLVLFGEADVWTPLAPCKAFLAAAQARGNPIELTTYPDAYHAFDAPNLKRTELPRYTTRDGRIPIVATDPAARAAVFARVPPWLAERMK